MYKFSIYLFILCFFNSTSILGSQEIKPEEDTGIPTLVYPAYRVSEGTSKDGSKLILNDGSIWNISWIDRSKVAKWDPEDEIEPLFRAKALFQGSNSGFTWISMQNKTKKNSADAYLSQKPDPLISNAVWIYDIDFEKGLVTLNNGIEFKIKDENRSISIKQYVANWHRGDVVFILFGYQKGYFESFYESFFGSTEDEYTYFLWNLIDEDGMDMVKGALLTDLLDEPINF